MAWAALSVHLVPIMVWKGIEEASAGLLAGAYPLLWIPAQLLVVRLAHRWSKPHLAAVAALISSTGYVLLAAFTHVEAWQILLVFALLAANETSWPLAWSMLAEQFGLRNFGVLKGIFMAVVSFMGLGAPAYAGWVFDRTVSYSWVVGPAAFLLILAGILTWLAFPGAGEHLEARRKPAS